MGGGCCGSPAMRSNVTNRRCQMLSAIPENEEEVLAGVLAEVRAERQRQDAKWGQQDFDPFHWLAVEGEELGEANRAANEWWHTHPEHLAEYRTEMIQVAAVAVA